MFVAVKLAKLGYYGGDPEKVLYAPLSHVLAVLDYERFDIALQIAYNELAREGV